MATNIKCCTCGNVVAKPESYLANKDRRILEEAERIMRDERRASKEKWLAEQAADNEARAKMTRRNSPAEAAQLEEEYLRQRFLS